MKVILIGNKVDLKEQRLVSQEEGAKFAEENNYYFKETSCEKNFNVADAFETIIIMTHSDMIKNGNQNKEININTEKEEKIELDSKLKKQKNQKNHRCCVIF